MPSLPHDFHSVFLFVCQPHPSSLLSASVYFLHKLFDYSEQSIFSYTIVFTQSHLFPNLLLQAGLYSLHLVSSFLIYSSLLSATFSLGIDSVSLPSISQNSFSYQIWRFENEIVRNWMRCYLRNALPYLASDNDSTYETKNTLLGIVSFEKMEGKKIYSPMN